MTEGAILGLAQAGASAVNTAGDFLSNAIFGSRNERWARQDATTAFNRQQQLLAEQRAYESPAAQMQRYIDAGLHPGLIYGQQQGSIAPPSVPQAASANVAPPSMSLDASGLLNARLIEAQIRRLDTQNQNDTEWTQAQKEKWAQENKESVERADLFHQQKLNAEKEFDRIQKEMNLLDQDIIDKRIENMFKLRTFQKRVQAAMDEYKMTHDKADRFVRILESSIAQAYGSAHLSEAQAKQIKELTPAEIRLKNMMAAFYQNSANKTLTEKQLLDIEKGLKEVYGEAETAASILEHLTSGNVLSTILKSGTAGIQSLLGLFGVRNSFSNF